ncbi:MAG: hypothetical protein V4719_10215 [Planctomycetota bacterium]
MTTTQTAGAGWMQTYSGLQFWPLATRSESLGEIRFVDIAQSLSNTCRYGGHTKKFYSVAQHCVLASHMIPAEFAKWGLMHDAAEAYLGDHIRPLKTALHVRRPAALPPWMSFSRVEFELVRRIGIRFGLDGPPPLGEIEEVDLRLLMSERDALLRPCPEPWTAFDHLTPEKRAELKRKTVPILPAEPSEARNMFCNRAVQLGIVSFEEAFPIDDLPIPY